MSTDILTSGGTQTLQKGPETTSAAQFHPTPLPSYSAAASNNDIIMPDADGPREDYLFDSNGTPVIGYSENNKVMVQLRASDVQYLNKDGEMCAHDLQGAQLFQMRLNKSRKLAPMPILQSDVFVAGGDDGDSEDESPEDNPSPPSLVEKVASFQDRVEANKRNYKSDSLRHTMPKKVKQIRKKIAKLAKKLSDDPNGSAAKSIETLNEELRARSGINQDDLLKLRFPLQETSINLQALKGVLDNLKNPEYRDVSKSLVDLNYNKVVLEDTLAKHFFTMEEVLESEFLGSLADSVQSAHLRFTNENLEPYEQIIQRLQCPDDRLPNGPFWTKQLDEQLEAYRASLTRSKESASSKGQLTATPSPAAQPGSQGQSIASRSETGSTGQPLPNVLALNKSSPEAPTGRQEHQKSQGLPQLGLRTSNETEELIGGCDEDIRTETQLVYPHTAKGIVHGWTKLGDMSCRVIVNAGLENEPHYRIYAGAEFGRLVREEIMGDKARSLQAVSQYLPAKSSDPTVKGTGRNPRCIDKVTSCVQVPTQSERRRPITYFLVHWNAKELATWLKTHPGKAPWNNIPVTSWLTRSDLGTFLGQDYMADLMERGLAKWNRRNKVFQAYRQRGDHPLEKRPLTPQEKKAMPWLAPVDDNPPAYIVRTKPAHGRRTYVDERGHAVDAPGLSKPGKTVQDSQLLELLQLLQARLGTRANIKEEDDREMESPGVASVGGLSHYDKSL